MSIIKRNFFVLGLLAFAAACGGSDKAAEESTGAAGSEAPATAAPAATEQAPAAPATAGQVIEVQMKTTNGGASGVFEPAEINAKKGDVIRFINDGAAAHNVSFPAAENAGAANLPAPSPYMTGAGQTFDLTVGMDAGSYTFQCDPHAAMGMKGKLTVTQ